jgi:molybdopterin/thiamine biosynthesis adenylyltransferase
MNDDKERYGRQVLAFGEEGDRKVRATSVVVVGLGGLGSQVVQALAYLGVREFLLIDDDRVSFSNLNRLAGAVPGDAEQKELKVVVAERLIRSIAPDARIVPLSLNLRSVDAFEAMPKYDVVFGCVDQDGSRLVLMEFCAAYRLPLIDIAAEIILGERQEPKFDGRVLVCKPGEYCIDCADQFDREQAKWDLASEEERSRRKAHGYGLGENVPAPAVVSLNGVLANLAVTEFSLWRTGLREPHRHLSYSGFRGKVLLRETAQKKPNCYTCDSLAGHPERADIAKYLKDTGK